jgi:drug/metabolite transporter (DMT)-like permease
VLLSAFFLGAHLSAAQIAGGLLVGSSLWLVNRQPR